MGDIYYFNPTCELAVANGSFSYQPPLLLQDMERDLAILPFVFCKSNDFVVVESKPSSEFLHSLQHLGFEIPSFCKLNELEKFPENSFDTIYPWGWSPAAHFKLKKLKEKCNEKLSNLANSEWREEHRHLFERATSLNFLHQFLTENQSDGLIAINRIGKIVNSIADIELLLAETSPLVLKAPMSSSGRGIQIIRKPYLNASNKQWIAGILKQQKYLTAEPYLKKGTDFSFQFKINSESEIEFLGTSFFETNTNGQYSGTLVSSGFEGEQNWYSNNELRRKILEVATAMQKKIGESEYARLYRGYIGVDAMIFEEDGCFMIQPCIEINCRMNMGILAKQLENKIHPQSLGRFKIFSGLPGKFKEFIHAQNEKVPVTQKDGKLYIGTIPLTEMSESTKFGAYLEVELFKY